MKATNETTEPTDRKMILSTLWIFTVFNSVFAILFTLFFDPVLQKETTQELLSRNAGSIQITQGIVLVAAILVEPPIAMILLSRVLRYRANRLANIVVGILWTVGVANTLFGSTPPSLFYVFLAAIQIASTLFVVWYAWTWPKPEGRSAVAQG